MINELIGMIRRRLEIFISRDSRSGGKDAQNQDHSGDNEMPVLIRCVCL